MSNIHFSNVLQLLEQYVRMQIRKEEIEKELHTMPVDGNYDNIEAIEKLEEEAKFLFSYSGQLIDQAAVIINENDVGNIPSIENIRNRLMLSST